MYTCSCIDNYWYTGIVVYTLWFIVCGIYFALGVFSSFSFAFEEVVLYDDEIRWALRSPWIFQPVLNTITYQYICHVVNPVNIMTGDGKMGKSTYSHIGTHMERSSVKKVVREWGQPFYSSDPSIGFLATFVILKYMPGQFSTNTGTFFIPTNITVSSLFFSPLTIILLSST